MQYGVRTFESLGGHHYVLSIDYLRVVPADIDVLLWLLIGQFRAEDRRSAG